MTPTHAHYDSVCDSVSHPHLSWLLAHAHNHTKRPNVALSQAPTRHAKTVTHYTTLLTRQELSYTLTHRGMFAILILGNRDAAVGLFMGRPEELNNR